MLLPGVKARDTADWLTPRRAASWREVIGQLSAPAEVKAGGAGGGNYSHYGVAMPGIDDLLAKAQQATTYEAHLDNCKQIELQVLRDLPLIGLSSLAFTVARNANVDLGYPVESGYARWRFHHATKSTT